MKQKYLVCKHCGNMVSYIKDKGVSIMCCGEKMLELIPGSVDASFEKHIPQFEVTGNKVIVKVGSAIHPMLDVHYIEWISIETNMGCQIKELKPNDEPSAEFILADTEKLISVYAYCNLHGLWVNKNE